jgi:hypothetical protein
MKIIIVCYNSKSGVLAVTIDFYFVNLIMTKNYSVTKFIVEKQYTHNTTIIIIIIIIKK